MNQTHRRGRHRRVRPLDAGRTALLSALGAAAVAGWTLGSVDADRSSPPRPASPQTTNVAAEAPAPIEHEGRVVAVSDDSLTTVTPDGEATTFRITPQTHRITGSFAPSQDVVVIGVIQDGIPVATAIADPRAVGPDGPPMDYGLPPAVQPS
ncbi:MAG: hypothetical protein SW019_17600 [Actinomycetota bacterium]|nr:hypothetical protein [Actinomycetota bacterium]